MLYRKMKRASGARRALFRSIVTSFLSEGRISTTHTKAKELSKIAEKMITLGKRGDLHARRQALSFILDEGVVKKLFDEIAPQYADKQGGYTRIYKIGPRRGDAAPMVLIELVK